MHKVFDVPSAQPRALVDWTQVVVDRPAGDTTPAATTKPAKSFVGEDLVMGRNVLVVSTAEHPEEVLREHLGEADTVKVVVPVVRQGLLDWLANDQKAFSHAERAAERAGEALPGETADAVAGEANVGLAVRDALADFPADEIIVVVRPDEREGAVESAATDTAPQHAVEGVPVRYVVIPGE